MKRNERGFTLVELLAVIVILGLLMAIAIPSVTKYITQSRVKTLISSMDSYVTAVVTSVNNGEYKFSDSTKVFAIPIECISLEKGGTNPFGNWYQANSAYWAYVLVHYDNDTYNYQYGFTFKDDAGYGLYPTLNSLITNSMVKTGYDDLNQPKDGAAIEFVTIDKWEGFSNITTSTELVVLEAESEGEDGDGQYTCTLCQKGDNYEQAEKEKEERSRTLSKLIKKHNVLITEEPTLTNSSNNSSDANGLYMSTATNSGNPTYYFRGNVMNNYVSFAGYTWRIIRINEDESVRLILNTTIAYVPFSKKVDTFWHIYYSNSDSAKPTIDSWYQSNIKDKGYDSYVSTGLFCEEARVKFVASYAADVTAGNQELEPYTTYVPTFKCKNDKNGKGILNLKAGLITYDEVMFAGGHVDKYNDTYYLFHARSSYMTMSPYGFYNSAITWDVYLAAYLCGITSSINNTIRPVINLKSDVLATGTGTSSDPYVVQTN